MSTGKDKTKFTQVCIWSPSEQVFVALACFTANGILAQSGIEKKEELAILDNSHMLMELCISVVKCDPQSHFCVPRNFNPW